jgi:DNA-binding winged helix-turn-helix (wHTH) protein
MPDRYEFAGYQLDVREQRLTRDGVPIKLTAKSIAVLALLAERAPTTVTRAEFEATIWPEGFIDPANLTQTIYMVRKALGEHELPIETVNGRGYRLATDVRASDDAARDDDEPTAHATTSTHRHDDGGSANEMLATDADIVRRAVASMESALARIRRTAVTLDDRGGTAMAPTRTEAATRAIFAPARQPRRSR